MKIEFEASPRGKALILSVAGVFVSLAGLVADLPGVSVAGICLATAGLITMWALRPRCNGYIRWTTTQDNEIQVGTCSGCNRWSLSVRGERVAHGRGFEAFQEGVSKIADTYHSYLPHLAMRLRKVLETIEANDESEVEKQA